jgi:hypothetical protein
MNVEHVSKFLAVEQKFFRKPFWQETASTRATLNMGGHG